MKVFEKLLAVQTELAVPKGKFNSFGDFSYRSCEDILEALKPLLTKYKATIKLDDSIVQIGERYYVNATAFFYDLESEDGVICANAYARETLERPKMDSAQLTGSASSYARKYALGALFLIDSAKDPDSEEYTKAGAEKPKKAPATNKFKQEADASVLDKYVNDGQLKALEMLLEKAGISVDKFNSIYGLTILSELPAEKYDEAVHKLEEAVKMNMKKKGE